MIFVFAKMKKNPKIYLKGNEKFEVCPMNVPLFLLKNALGQVIKAFLYFFVAIKILEINAYGKNL